MLEGRKTRLSLVNEHNVLAVLVDQAAHLFFRLVLSSPVAPFTSGRTVVKTQQQMTVCTANLILTASCQRVRYRKWNSRRLTLSWWWISLRQHWEQFVNYRSIWGRLLKTHPAVSAPKITEYKNQNLFSALSPLNSNHKFHMISVNLLKYLKTSGWSPRNKSLFINVEKVTYLRL